MGKGEIARYEQFLLSPQCFQKACFPEASKGVIVWEWVNSLPNNKIWGLTKLKVVADNKFKFAKMLISLFDRVENIVGKEENACYQHFLLFLYCFQKASFSGSVKVGIVW